MTMAEEPAERIRWAAFDQLRTGRPAPVADVAATLGVAPAAVEESAVQLAAAGYIERDSNGVIIGAHGLTLKATGHRLVLDGSELHTWCALDAVGIPAALGADAEVATHCPWCDRTIRVHIDGGAPSSDSPTVLWLPTTPCADVRQEFCPLANLFCHRDHLDRWHDRSPELSGDVLDLEGAADLGRRWWSRPAGYCEAGPFGGR
jgi:alkylmercury lyase